MRRQSHVNTWQCLPVLQCSLKMQRKDMTVHSRKDKSSPRPELHPNWFLTIHLLRASFNIIFQFFSYALPLRVSCAAHRIRLDLIIASAWASELRNLLHSPFYWIYSLSVGLCSSFSVNHHVLHPRKRNDKIIVL